MRYQVRSAALTGFQAEVGSALAGLLEGTTLSLEQLQDGDRLLDVEPLQALMERAARRLGRQDLGLRVARHQGLEMLGVLGLLITRAASLREAFGAAQNHMALHSSAEYWRMQQYGDHVRIYRTDHALSAHPAQQYREMALAVFHRLARLLGGSDISPRRIEFAHSAVSSLKTYTAYFGCEVLFDQECDCLVYPGTLFDHPMRRPEVIPSASVDPRWAAIRDGLGQHLELQVRNLIAQTLGLQRLALDDIARLLGLHPRALQRRLAAQQLCFKQLLQEVKMNTACWHLRASSLDITRLSHMLGYADLSAFSRAFRSHFGRSPRQWRQAHAS
ncbi:MAG: AraC family transcriptional regulator [Pseudomonas sp.]|uniref:AraC family transcriptional regulator n=1 Tax=Pseudomonas sp. TaxID=306 RepID=UPI0033953661